LSGFTPIRQPLFRVRQSGWVHGWVARRDIRRQRLLRLHPDGAGRL